MLILVSKVQLHFDSNQQGGEERTFEKKTFLCQCFTLGQVRLCNIRGISHAVFSIEKKMLGLLSNQVFCPFGLLYHLSVIQQVFCLNTLIYFSIFSFSYLPRSERRGGGRRGSPMRRPSPTRSDRGYYRDRDSSTDR